MDKSAQISKAQIGQKRPQPEEEKKGGLDVRDLVGRFRSKADIYEYLREHSKYTIS